MTVKIEPEPAEPEREAIILAVAEMRDDGLGAWESAALAEGVDDAPDP